LTDLNTYLRLERGPAETSRLLPVARQVEWLNLTKHEIERAIFRSSPDKAPGLDEISFRVWRELWPVVRDHLLRLYTASVDLGYTPKQ
jgi:hypothetical protein